MKILIIGTGLLGSNLARLVLKNGMDVVGTYYNNRLEIPGCEIYRLDKTDRQKLDSFIKNHRPGITVDTAAVHNVDDCENFPEKSWARTTSAPSWHPGGFP